MNLPWSDLQGFAGATGVGAIVILAAFLGLDGANGRLFPSFEAYAKTGTWAIVAAVPTLALAYVVGLLTMGAGRSLVEAISGIGIPSSDIIAFRGKTFEVALTFYRQKLQEADVLAGSALALLLLAAGALVEVRNLPHLKGVIRLAALLSLVAAVGAGWLSASRAQEANGITKAIASPVGP